MYAGALEPAIASVTSEGAVASYIAIARAKTHSGLIDIAVPGVLKDFDLPDVAALIAPRPLHIAAARAGNGATLELAEVQQEYAPTVKQYSRVKHPDALRISTTSVQ